MLRGCLGAGNFYMILITLLKKYIFLSYFNQNSNKKIQFLSDKKFNVPPNNHLPFIGITLTHYFLVKILNFKRKKNAF